VSEWVCVCAVSAREPSALAASADPLRRVSVVRTPAAGRCQYDRPSGRVRVEGSDHQRRRRLFADDHPRAGSHRGRWVRVPLSPIQRSFYSHLTTRTSCIRRWLRLWLDCDSTAIRLQLDPLRSFDDLPVRHDRAATLVPSLLLFPQFGIFTAWLSVSFNCRTRAVSAWPENAFVWSPRFAGNTGGVFTYRLYINVHLLTCLLTYLLTHTAA